MLLDRLSTVPVGIRCDSWPVPNTALQLHLFAQHTDHCLVWSDYCRSHTLKWTAATFDLFIIPVLKDAIDVCLYRNFATSDGSVIGEM
jgi:hypothetical protein